VKNKKGTDYFILTCIDESRLRFLKIVIFYTKKHLKIPCIMLSGLVSLASMENTTNKILILSN
jgi:hypothetical protein